MFRKVDLETLQKNSDFAEVVKMSHICSDERNWQWEKPIEDLLNYININLF